MPFLDSLDIANRACQHCGVTRIASVTEDTKNNNEIAFVYDKLRRAELRRNVWVFATKHTLLRAMTATTMLLDPRPWDATVTYLPGAIVADADGDLWTSTVADNVNNAPGSSSAWDQYFGPMTADLYDSGTTYYAGELVYQAAGNPGSFVLFVSLVNGNADNPGTGTAWDATVQYGLDDVVRYSGTQYRSLIPFNINITPANGPADWDIDVTYTAAQQATGSDGYIYTAVGTTTGNDPVTDNGSHWTNTNVARAWSSSPTLYQSSQKWLPVASGLKNLTFNSPMGAGEVTKSIFRLPANYLRTAPQNPKQGVISYLGVPAFAPALDWEYQGDFFLSTDAGPLLFRFVADVTDVRKMDDMFCEGFAARIGLEVCEVLTQSTGKKRDIGAEYKTFMSDARTVNAIEIGPVEETLDDFLACRV